MANNGIKSVTFVNNVYGYDYVDIKLFDGQTVRQALAPRAVNTYGCSMDEEGLKYESLFLKQELVRFKQLNQKLVTERNKAVDESKDLKKKLSQVAATVSDF